MADPWAEIAAGVVGSASELRTLLTAGDLPHISLPNDVSPFKSLQTQREFVSSEDLGYSEK